MKPGNEDFRSWDISTRMAGALYLLGYTPRGVRRMPENMRNLYGIKPDKWHDVYMAILALDDWDEEEI